MNQKQKLLDKIDSLKAKLKWLTDDLDKLNKLIGYKVKFPQTTSMFQLGETITYKPNFIEDKCTISTDRYDITVDQFRIENLSGSFNYKGYYFKFKHLNDGSTIISSVGYDDRVFSL